MKCLTSHIRLIFFTLVILAGVLIAPISYANNNLVIELSYLVDDHGTLSVQDVREKKFQRYDSFLNRGYVDSVTWIKVLVKKPEISEFIILRTRPYFIDRIDLYSEDDLVPNLKRTTGDSIKLIDLPYQGKSHGFRIYPKQKLSTYYLRVQTSSSTILAVDALTQDDLENTEELENLLLGIYLGFMLWILAWALLNFKKNKDPILGSFAIYQFVNVLMAFSYTGYIGRFVFHDFISRDIVTSNLVLLASVTGFFFHKNFLIEFNLNRYIKGSLYVIFGFTIFNLFLGNFYKFSVSLEINAYLILISVFTFGVIQANIYIKTKTENILVLLVYALLNFVVIFTLLPLLGVVRSTELALHTSLTHGLFTGLLVFALMHDRSKKLQVKQRDFEMESLLIKQKLIGEQKIRETQDAFIGMLSHELKSPLGVIRLGLNNLKRKIDQSLKDEVSVNINRLNIAIDDMDLVIERCVEVNRIEYDQVVINKNRVCISALIKDLVEYRDEFKIRVEFLGKEDTYFETDHQFIRIIIANLLDNAVKYSVKGSMIKISCISTINGLEVSCENFIDAIRLIDPEQIFNKYYRDEESKRQRGSGLGLWLSRQLAKLLGGDLVYSQSGNQVQFKLNIYK